MIVTRSSALSLQAKLGLPRGNQIVGWAVLGMHVLFQAGTYLLSISPAVNYAILASFTTQQPLPTPIDGHILDIFSDIRHSYNILRRTLLFRVLCCLNYLGPPGAQGLYLRGTTDQICREWYCCGPRLIGIFSVPVADIIRCSSLILLPHTSSVGLL